jgi:hypothetical protein
MNDKSDRNESVGTGNSSNREKLKAQYHVSDEQVQEAIDAMGDNSSKVVEYLKQAFGKNSDDEKKISLKDIAANPNPSANANIGFDIKDRTTPQLKKEKEQPGNEITDGEDG